MSKFMRALMVLVLIPLTAVGMVAGAAPASAAGAVSAGADAGNGFPQWYQDAAGNRVAQCLDPADANCVLLASPSFDPAAPLAFPSNFPDEFFYALADSEIVDTPGCVGTPPGKASVRLALEGAFINGAPAAADRMVFGRIRVKVTSGLCPNTTYQFRHPFGTETLTTNDAGGIKPVVGTEDIGCVPTPGVLCTFGLATGSRVFGTAGAGGFLRWDPAVAPAAPAGYLGDGGATLHAVTGGTSGNAFRILDSAGNDTGIGTAQFAVAGKLAGSLASSPSPADFAGTPLGTTRSRTLAITNLDSAAVTVGAATSSSDEFVVTGGTCAAGPVLNRDQSCSVDVAFTPAGLAGRRTAALTVESTGGVRSPLSVVLTGSGTNVGDAPAVTLSTGTLAFGSVRVRETSALKHLVVTNSGTAPLTVTDVSFDPATTPEPDHYRMLGNTCSTGQSVDPGATCTIDVEFAPFTTGAHNTAILLSSNTNTGLDSVAVTGTGTGGVAAVSGSIDATNGFPDWYRDEAGIKVSQCIDPADPHCIVLGDQFFDPARPVSFPDNYPSEFFYQVATSDNVEVNDPTCGTADVGRAFARSAVEGAFSTGAPIPGDQMVFGRIRFSVTGGLCPSTDYVFRSPYGDDHFVTDASGALKRVAGTNDVGCFPAAGAACDYSLALSSRVLGGLVRWDPAVAPAAPAGYLGDAVTLHPIVGAPYSTDGVTPNNFFEIARADDGTVIGRTDLWSVMGKLRGPLEADQASVNLGGTALGSTSGTAQVVLTNTGIAPLTITSAGITGADAADFSLSAGACTGTTLAVGDTCTLSASFSPSATGARTASVEIVHTAVNSPVVVALTGTGGATGTAAAISFTPRSVAFEPLHVGRSSAVQTVRISNAGGTLPLTVFDAGITGAAAADFAVVDNRCLADVAPGGSCQIDVVFSPQAAGQRSAALSLSDNAPGATHTVALTGAATTANAAVSATTDSRNGFPQWYQDSNGTRIEPCLDPTSGTCVLLADATYKPANPLAFPTNFPAEFFYSVADSQLVATPGCGALSAPGTALLRLALEGSFANGTPAAGDQITFGRVRVVVTSGLCPSTPYTFLTPYGPFTFTTDTTGALRKDGTIDTGGGALAFDGAVGVPTSDSFLRYDPNVAPAAPAGTLGDAVSFHRVVGGTYTPLGASGPVNAFAIADSAGNELGRTDSFMIAAHIAGPLQADAYALDFSHVPAGTTSGQRTITVTNVGAASSLTSIATAGTNAAEFQVVGGTCAVGDALAADAACTVKVAFAPASTGVKTASLRIVPATGPALVVSLKGLGDPALAPAIAVAPGVLAYGTRTAGTSTTLTTTVSNTGTANLLVGAPSLTGAAAADYRVTANGCAAAVAPGASCTISVAFSPLATGARSASLVIPHNATGGSTTVSLSGTGVASTFTASPSPVKFGSVGLATTKTQTVSVKNSGTLGFTLTSASVTGAQAAFFGVTGPGCLGTVLAAGKSCNITVSFRPTQAIAYTATLAIVGDSTTLPRTVTISLTGNGK